MIAIPTSMDHTTLSGTDQSILIYISAMAEMTANRKKRLTMS